MIPQVHLFLFVFQKKLKTPKNILKLTDLQQIISQIMGVKIEKKKQSLHCACDQMNGLHVASKGFQKFRAPPLKHDDDSYCYTPVGFPFLITDVSKPERQTKHALSFLKCVNTCMAKWITFFFIPDYCVLCISDGRLLNF